MSTIRDACARVLGIEDRAERIIWFATGTDALGAALAIARRRRGARRDRVVCPACVCPQVWFAIESSGARPTYIATRPGSGGYPLDLEALDSVAAEDAFALLWIHQYGSITQVDEVRALAARKDWVLIEDAALTFGARSQSGAAAGTLGDAGILSFGSGKIVNAGYGGALVLGPRAVDEDWSGDAAQIPIDAGRCEDGTAASDFDGLLKNLYNHRYGDFRSGRCAGLLESAMRRLARPPVRADEQTLTNALTPAMVAAAPAVATERRTRAVAAAVQLAGKGISSKPVLHDDGTYWRLNVVVDAPARHRILSEMLAQNIPISSWYPPLYWMTESAERVGDGAPQEEFADSVLNLWLDGVGDMTSYVDRVATLAEAALHASKLNT